MLDRFVFALRDQGTFLAIHEADINEAMNRAILDRAHLITGALVGLVTVPPDIGTLA